MEIDLLSILSALGGGFFGAAIGALQAFVFTGFLVIAGVAAGFAAPDANIVGDLAFGPAFGPHIAFAGGVAAAAYAARRGYGEMGGKDIVKPLANLGRPDVLAVGALFGLFGYFVQKLVSIIPFFGSHTDSVALTVVISAIVVRIVFGRTKLFQTNDQNRTGFGAFSPTEAGHWIRAQEKTPMAITLGAGAGLFGAFVGLALVTAFPDLPNAATFVFGISAVSLLFLSAGLPVPVTHHITLPASLAAVTFLPIVGGNTVVALLIGVVAGIIGALLGELFARLWVSHGDTHIDPPAAAIWPTTTLVLGVAAFLPAAA